MNKSICKKLHGIFDKNIPILILIALLLSTSLFFLFDSPFPNYEIYFESLITSIGIILGLILVVTMFYLGKFRDYYRETIRFQRIVSENFDIYKARFDEFKNIREDLRSYVIENKINDNEKLSQIFNKMKEKETERDESLSSVNKNLIKLENFLISFKFTKTIIQDFIVYTMPFVIGFIISNLFINRTTLGSFYFLIAYLSISVIIFFNSWRLNENKMESLDQILVDATEWNKNFNVSRHHLETMIAEANKLLSDIKLKHTTK